MRNLQSKQELIHKKNLIVPLYLSIAVDILLTALEYIQSLYHSDSKNK